MYDSHIRLNRATREWVIYAPNRRLRPQDFQADEPAIAPDSGAAERCPFCKLKTSDAEPIIFELPTPDGNGWLTRVVANKYPALSPDVSSYRSLSGMYLELPAHGHHEIVIESPNHDQTIATLSVNAVAAVIETYRQRYLDLIELRDTLMVIIFRNHGKRAGASLQHPHSQIITTPIVPRYRRWQEDEAERYFDEWGRCAYCDMVEFERHDRHRVVAENEEFIAFVPYAAEVPFEIWILPKQHQTNFGQINDFQIGNFAVILRQVLGKLYDKLYNPAYNYVINTAARFTAASPHLHWYCRIRPRLTTSAGFEIGSGISINPSLPEADAAFLNGETDTF